MTKKRLSPFVYAIAVASLLAGGYLAGRARAGVPSMAPVMTYTGTLTDTAGVPLTGAKNIQLILWDAATAGVSRCLVGPSSVTLAAGSFALPIDSCVSAIQTYPDLWAELLVGGESLGRTKLGAVPYAIEASNAATAQAAAGPLNTRIMNLETNRVVGQDSSGKSLKICRGTTPPGNTAWRPYNSYIAVTVDISSCGFTAKPVIVSSLAGTSNHWQTTGGSNPYPPTTGTDATAFDIFVFYTPGPFTSAQANMNNWHIEWVAAGY